MTTLCGESRPKNDAAPLAGRAVVNVESIHTKYSDARPAAGLDTPFDCGLVYALYAMIKYPSARALAHELGPALFPAGAGLRLAAAILAGESLDDPLFTGATARLRDRVMACRLELDEEWALDLVRGLAKVRHAEILAGQLAWASVSIRDGQVPLDYARRHVEHAFNIAMGEVPLDASEAWEVAA